MIQTSYFANHRNFPEGKKKISISRFTPKWFQADHNALELAPSVKLLTDYKNGLVDEAGYDKRYREETLSILDPKEIAKKYKDSIFLCYESENDFCHRKLVADWLIANGENVEEIVNNIRIAIVGSRNFNDYELFKKYISKLTNNYKHFTFVSGGAIGADQFAERYAEEFNIDIDIYPAKWYNESGQYIKAAGFIRNKEIWDNSDIGIAFWDGSSNGTKHSFEISKKQNKKLYLVNYNEKKTTLLN